LYEAVVHAIPAIPRLTRTRGSRTPYLDHLAAFRGGQRTAAAVFGVALAMVRPAYAAAAADELIRLAPDVRARRMSPLDVRNVAVARAGREGRDEQATDLLGYADAEVLDLRRPVVAPTPLLSPELIETVTSYVARVYGRQLTAATRDVLDVAVPVVVELIESYPDGASQPPGAVLVSMQRTQCAREGRCLVTRLRAEGMADRVAIAAGRLLAGRAKDPRASMIWHALRRTPPESLPLSLVRLVRRDIADLDPGQFADDLARKRVRDRIGRATDREWAQRAATGQDEVAVGQ
jgi:hypothetical protein